MKRKISYAMMFGLFVLTSCQTKQEQQHEVLKVETMTAEYRTDVGDSQYVGQVEESSSTAVSFASMGTLRQVLVDEGQHVSKGQVVAILDDASTQSALAAAKAQMDQAHDALARMKQLHDTNSLPEIKWVEVQSQVQQAEAQYALMKKQVSDCQLVAPCSGIVGKGVKNTGEVAVPSAPILNILNINKVKVKVSIPEKELASLTPGTAASITCDALPGAQFRSSSFTKGVQADALTHTYEVSFWVNNPDGRLLPGMVCQVCLSDGHTSQETAVITVPVRCIQQGSDGKDFVWVVRDGKSHRQDISLGVTIGNDIIVTSGIAKGDNIIIAGYQKVSENSAVDNH